LLRFGDDPLQLGAMSFDLTGASPDDRMFIGNTRIANN
jgi:hypothetical protein